MLTRIGATGCGPEKRAGIRPVALVQRFAVPHLVFVGPLGRVPLRGRDLKGALTKEK
ncbi:hypothetical protein GCM10007385_06750 [Tateyamaria omphalii]|nr:hypothetical protein GCM10007385_06750 [Tateyamaria omphalii]